MRWHSGGSRSAKDRGVPITEVPNIVPRSRVVIVVTVLDTAQNFVVGFAEHLTACNYDVTLVCDQGDQLVLPEGSLVRAVAVPMCRDPHPFRDCVSLVQLTRVLARLRPNVVMYATPKASLLAAVAARVARVPERVYQLWGLRLETSTGLMRRVLSTAERVTSASSTAILANSFSLAEQFRSLGLSSGRTVQVLGYGSSHGVDVERFSQDVKVDLGLHVEDCERWPEDSRKPPDLTVGFVGRLHPDKGLGELVEAMKICHGEGLNITLIVVGRGEGYQLPAELLSNAFGRVILIEHVADPRPIYRAIDVLVLPSHREGFPNVVLEAAAMGVPAIVSNATGVRDSVVDGVTGSIVPVHDSTALAQRIRWYAEHPGAATVQGARARVHVVQHYSQRAVWDATSDFISRQFRAHAGRET